MCEKFDSDESSPARLAVTTEGPAYLLGMDELLAKRSDAFHREQQFIRLHSSVLDREHLADWTRLAVKNAGQPDAVANKEGMRIEGTTWMSMSHGSSFTGNLPLALGCFAYQIEGDRLVAMIDSMECVGCLSGAPSEITPEMGPDIIKAAVHFFQDLDQDAIESLSLQTFSHTYVQSGDILYVPSGAIVCEKAVTRHNVLLRVPSTLLSTKTTSSCCLVAGACGVQTAINTVIMEAAASFEDHGVKGRAKFLQSSVRSAIAAPAAGGGAASSSSLVKTEGASDVKVEEGPENPNGFDVGNQGFDSDPESGEEKKTENCETARIDNTNTTPADQSEVPKAQDRGQDGSEHHGAQELEGASDKEHHGAQGPEERSGEEHHGAPGLEDSFGKERHGLEEVPDTELHGHGSQDQEKARSDDTGLAEIIGQQDATHDVPAGQDLTNHDVPAGEDLTIHDVPPGEDLATAAASIGEDDAAAPVEEQSDGGKTATLSSGASPPSTATAPVQVRLGAFWKQKATVSPEENSLETQKHAGSVNAVQPEADMENKTDKKNKDKKEKKEKSDKKEKSEKKDKKGKKDKKDKGDQSAAEGNDENTTKDQGKSKKSVQENEPETSNSPSKKRKACGADVGSKSPKNSAKAKVKAKAKPSPKGKAKGRARGRGNGRGRGRGGGHSHEEDDI